jgi:hypothetical protein
VKTELADTLDCKWGTSAYRVAGQQLDDGKDMDMKEEKHAD